MGIDTTTPEGKATWVKKLQDDEFQFAFVAKKIAAITDISTSDPHKAGYDITVNFERPADRFNKGKKRGDLAKQIFTKYKDKLTRSEESPDTYATSEQGEVVSSIDDGSLLPVDGSDFVDDGGNTWVWDEAMETHVPEFDF